jgi:hypothetical protein
MTPLSIQVPFPVFQDRDGQPLDNGYVWIGVPNLPPQTNPVNVYFDEALTILAPQPLRTINGYISRFGSPAQVYIDGVNFSILVQDSKGSMVYNFPDGSGISPDACGVTYNPPFTGAVPTPVCVKLAETVSVKDFGAVGDGVTDDTAAIQLAIDYATSINGSVSLVAGATYKTTSVIYITCNFYGYDSFVNTTGNTASAAFVIQANKTPDTNAITIGKKVELPYLVNTTAPTTGWAGQGNGVVVNTTDSCLITTNVIVGFNVGLLVTANFGVAGTANNTFNLGRIVSNNYNVLLQPNGAAAYVNANTFINGKLGYFSSNPNGAATLALLPFSGATNGPNQNNFYSVNIEGGATLGASPDFHLIVGGSFNSFFGTRFEFVGGLGRIQFLGASATENLFVGGYSFGEIVVSGSPGAPASTNIFYKVGRYVNRDGSYGTYANVPQGGGRPYLRMYGSTKDLSTATFADTDWSCQINSAGEFQTKSPSFHTVASAQLTGNALQVNNGTAPIGSGPFITFVATSSIGTTTSYLQAGSNGAWNGGHLKIGVHHLWVDSTGNLRIKFGAPTSDTDGTVVGTQT